MSRNTDNYFCSDRKCPNTRGFYNPNFNKNPEIKENVFVIEKGNILK